MDHCEDDRLDWTETDGFSQRLTFTTPMDLRRLEVPHDLDPWNSVVLAFIIALPVDARDEREER